MTAALCFLSGAFGFVFGMVCASILILATEDRDSSRRTRRTDR